MSIGNEPGWIPIDFILVHDCEEISIGQGWMPHAPRVGEEIWLCPQDEKPPVRVESVAYWVGDFTAGRKGKLFAENSLKYCHAAVYVEFVDPTDKRAVTLLEKHREAAHE